MRWIFLRGWTREVKHWMEFPREFEKTLPGHFVHCLELPGFGNSRHQKSPLSVSTIKDWLRLEFLELKNKYPNEPWSILGISLGGMVTLSWISEEPQDFERAVIMNSSAKNLSSIQDRLQLRSLLKLLSSIKAKKLMEREKIILNVVSHFHKTPPYNPSKIPLANAARQIIAAARFQLIEPVEIKSLVLCSESDQILKSSACKRLAEKINAELRIHPTAGHDLPLDDPRWCLHEIQNWISKS